MPVVDVYLIKVVQFWDGKEHAGWIGEDFGHYERYSDAGVFTMQEVVDLLPTLDYENCNLKEAKVIYHGKAEKDIAPPIAAGVVCKCPDSFCPMHGKLDRSELKKGRRTRG
jgi:hypothetical protein